MITSWRHFRGTIANIFLDKMKLLQFYDPIEQPIIDTYRLYYALVTTLLKKTALGRLAARKISTRSNPDAEPLQIVFYLESLIRTTNKLKRLVQFSLYRTSSLPSEGTTFIDDISEHGGQNFDLILPRTKSESSLSKVVFDPSPFDFFMHVLVA